MKKAILILLIIFTLTAFPIMAQDNGDTAEPTSTTETQQDSADATEDTEIKIDISIAPKPFEPIQALAGAFCGHGC